jgi:hypothetical protein
MQFAVSHVKPITSVILMNKVNCGMILEVEVTFWNNSSTVIGPIKLGYIICFYKYLIGIIICNMCKLTWKGEFGDIYGCSSCLFFKLSLDCITSDEVY